MSTPSPIFPVLAHDYNSTLVQHACIYELLPPDTLSSPPSTSPLDVPEKKNALVFIGGLGDGPHTVPAIRAVAGLMGEQLPEWSVFEVRLNSSFGQWGFSSLREDVLEIGEVVGYLRRRLGRSRVVLMGHSTGCQVGFRCCSSECGGRHWEGGWMLIIGAVGLHGVCYEATHRRPAGRRDHSTGPGVG